MTTPIRRCSAAIVRDRIAYAARRIEGLARQAPVAVDLDSCAGVPPARFHNGQGVFVRDRHAKRADGRGWSVRAGIIFGAPEFRRGASGRWMRWIYRVVVGDDVRTLPETRIFPTDDAARRARLGRTES